MLKSSRCRYQLALPGTRQRSMVRGFAESFAGCLLADAEDGGDLSPGPSVPAGFRNLVGQCKVDGRNGVKRLRDGTQVGAIGVRRREGFGVKCVEPGFGGGDRLLELGARSWHRVHLR